MAPAKKNKSRKSQRADAGSIVCDSCGESVRNRGRKQHKCDGKAPSASLSDVFKEIAAQEALERERSLASMQEDWNAGNGQSSKTTLEDLARMDPPVSPMQEDFNDVFGEAFPPEGNNPGPNGLFIHDIRIRYHPHSGRPTENIRLDDQRSRVSESIPGIGAGASSLPPREPWYPFRSRLDFEVAEFALNTHLNKTETETLLSLIKRCIKDPDQHTLKDQDEITEYWDMASMKTTAFEKSTVAVPYRGEEIEFDVWTRPLWSWCEELLSNKEIVSQFQWDAQEVSKHNGLDFERCIDEPWTASMWWDIQSTLPEDAKPFFILLYADKTRLSSFGTAKAHPVIARCANLPIELRNAEEIDGGRVVGWLPIVKEDARESGKPGYVNMKRVVWHKAFAEILKSAETHSKFGCRFDCADFVQRWIFPIILILSADYEEQCIMALIRGINSHYPCPICLVPAADLSNLSKDFPLRTTDKMREVYETAQRAETAAGKETILKQYGLRDVENVFWSLKRTEVFAALSWDRLHAYHGGLFSDHLWVRFKEIINELGRSSAEKFDNQIDAIPRWRNLNHFSKLLKNSEFSDGSKYEDMGKILLYGAYNVLTSENSDEGFLLLQVIRSYVELDMYASLTMHTEGTIAAGRAELLRYDGLIQEYKRRFPDSKSWDFPKAHTHKHLFDDIERKGATRGYNSKPNEKKHRPFKKFYLFNTNFKDTDKQILKLEHRSVISLIIRRAIEALDAVTDVSDDDKILSENTGPDHVTTGSPLPTTSLAALEREHSGDLAWSSLRKKVGKAFSGYFNEHITFRADDKINIYQYLKVRYEAILDAREIRTDILRVNPSFHGQPRYDCALIKVNEQQCMLAQLLCVFSIEFREKTYYMALILPMDHTTQLLNRPRDRALRLTRVRSRKRSDTVVVDVETLIRGAVLIPEHDSSDEFFVFDTPDDDFWWRMKSINLAQNVNL